jgi:hypothetical protein
MSTTTEEQRKLRVLYCNLMDEVKLRIELITKILDHRIKLPEFPAFELCYLQLRMICELIALACIAAHGDKPFTQSSRMRSTHQADFILNALEALHPSFYPAPGVPVDHPDGGRVFIPSKADYMTKAALVKLYYKCGDILHRGSFKRFKDLKEMDFDAIAEARLKLIELLKFHSIALLSSDDELWFEMENSQTGKVRATLVRP